jgi:hypothetical protein
MPTFLQDFRHSLRLLIKSPGFALSAILSLAFGIGATVSVFSVIYGVLMHPIPYANVDQDIQRRPVHQPLFYQPFQSMKLRGPQSRTSRASGKAQLKGAKRAERTNGRLLLN